MKLTNQLVHNALLELVGEDALPIVNFLKNRKDISEFIVSEKTKTEIHLVRNILYRMESLNLAKYKRRKNKEKGYYISYWTLNLRRIKDLLKKLEKEKLEKLKERLEKEEANRNNFFICSKMCARLDFEQATNFGFRCPECGSLLQQQDNSKTIDHLRQKIEEIEKELK
jgi:transcription initiation factor TFIIE subunit alpha